MMEFLGSWWGLLVLFVISLAWYLGKWVGRETERTNYHPRHVPGLPRDCPRCQELHGEEDTDQST